MELSWEQRIVLDFKPFVPTLSDEDWVGMARSEGIGPSLLSCFWDWMERQDIPSSKFDSEEYFEILLGSAGRSAYILSKRDGEEKRNRKRFQEEMLSQTWRPEELGQLGRWIELARLNSLTTQLIQLLLNDRPT
ncbi:hypothetical protein K2Q08_00980 [Patescibacteria group bacterium]|nr:hypothetical protein [Patescibacteria group bacterium]